MAAGTPDNPKSGGGDAELRIDLEPVGTNSDEYERLKARVLNNRALRKALGEHHHRLLAFQLLDPERKPKNPALPRTYRATVFDYDANCALIAEGPISGAKPPTIEERGIQPPATFEEWQDAVARIRRDRTLGPKLREGRLIPYRPMPPVLAEDPKTGRSGRIVTVRLMPRRGHRGHEIVGVDMRTRKILHFVDRAPPGGLTNQPHCGPAPVYQPTTIQGEPGEALISVYGRGGVLWRFRAIRPAASSGTNGSGIELRYVDYLGKRVLGRAHAPILNVKYDNDFCGPYLDWQYEEGWFDAPGRDLGASFRLCSQRPRTMIESGSDEGNFRGVAIWVEGSDVILVSEMAAGHYRYVTEWRLSADGTIRPRYGFAAADDSCTCRVHHHHVYWRFDFDIVSAEGNRILETTWPRRGISIWEAQRFEARRGRNYRPRHLYRVEKVPESPRDYTPEAYEIVPGADGIASHMPDWPFGQGDVWFVRNRVGELDHRVQAVGPPEEANIDTWVNGEPIENADVVVWYGAHVTHDAQADANDVHGHVVGPELRPVNWI